MGGLFGLPSASQALYRRLIDVLHGHSDLVDAGGLLPPTGAHLHGHLCRLVDHLRELGDGLPRLGGELRSLVCIFCAFLGGDGRGIGRALNVRENGLDLRRRLPDG